MCVYVCVCVCKRACVRVCVCVCVCMRVYTTVCEYTNRDSHSRATRVPLSLTIRQSRNKTDLCAGSRIEIDGSALLLPISFCCHAARLGRAFAHGLLVGYLSTSLNQHLEALWFPDSQSCTSSALLDELLSSSSCGFQ